MDRKTFEQRWEALAEEVITGMADWRGQHPKATFREIETALDERLDRMRARMLSDAAMTSERTDWSEASPEERPLCPECQEPLSKRSVQKRRLQSQGGTSVEIAKPGRHLRRDCKARAAPPSRLKGARELVRSVGEVFFPLDEELELLPGSLTPRLAEEIVHLGAWLPFRKAARMVERFRRVTVSEGTVRSRTEEAGAILVREQEAEVERLEREFPPSSEEEKTLFMSVDGAMVPLRAGEWGEAKTLVIGQVQAGLKKGERVVVTRDVSSFSRLTDAETFERAALGELHRRGVGGAERVVTVNDGAEWIQGFIDYHRPDAVRILDFAHAAQRVSGIGRAVYGEGSKETSDWEKAIWKRMKQDEPEKWLPDLKAFAKAAAETEAVSESLAYLEKRAGQMRYASYQEAGWPIGSGTVESGNKLIVEFRLKGSGMRWSRVHVNPMLALRNAVCSDRWEETFPAIHRRKRLETTERKRNRTHERKRCSQANAITPLPLEIVPPPPSTPDPSCSASRVRPSNSQKHPHPWRSLIPGDPSSLEIPHPWRSLIPGDPTTPAISPVPKTFRAPSQTLKQRRGIPLPSPNGIPRSLAVKS